MATTKTPEEIRSLLSGPVNSIPTPFRGDGAVDWQGVRRIIEVGIAGGSAVSLLTYGDSQFDFLSDEEVEQLTRCLAEQVAGRVFTVAATRKWPDERAVAFARRCRDLGIDVLMVLPPDHASPKGRIRHYLSVAEVMPVMLVGCPPFDVLDALADAPNICCFKEDGTVEYAPEAMQRYAHRWKFVTGGGLWRNLTQWPWSPAFFCYFSSFAPHIAQRYWMAYQEGDARAAGELVRTVEMPFAALAAGFAGGFQALWRAALELNGVAERYLRAPAVSPTAEEVAAAAPAIERLELITRPLG
ncbi:MAG: dihydrodipicolinate synthase family protein [Gemmatimonadota bacterium]